VQNSPFTMVSVVSAICWYRERKQDTERCILRQRLSDHRPLELSSTQAAVSLRI
jgi:hypothetical protein